MAHALRVGTVLIAVALFGCSHTRPYIAEAYKDWASVPPPAPDEIAYRIFLIGDAGSPPSTGHRDPLPLLRRKLVEAGEQSAVVFLGDNIYCCGLPDSAHALRDSAEARLRRQLDAVRDVPGRIFFVPGNHDWNNAGPGGLAAVQRQERFVESTLDRGNTFLPDEGFPGPAVVKLAPGVVLMALDTEWWLTRHERATGDAGDYEIEEEGDILLQLEEELQRHDDDHVLVVGHHPLYSNGQHAGRFSLKTHLFPLTFLWDNAYVPLPGIGSLLPLYIRLFGTRQDLAHPAYRAMRTGLERAFGEHESVIYAAGHEHSLQYYSGLLHDFVVSGAGARPEHAARGGQAAFTHSHTGFATLLYGNDGSVWVEFWEPGMPADQPVFRTRIEGPARDRIDPGVPALTDTFPDYADSTRTIAANPSYDRGPLHKFLLGTHNRPVWALPVTVPVLDMGREAGGLTPVKRGGGMQTFSLRLRGADGLDYSLRSIDKDPSVSLPPALRETVARDLVQDQIASIHPYGAFALPPLARAADIYHTVPRLVFVPDDPRLGIYRETFGDQLMMLELRPDDDMSAYPNFGRSEKVVSAQRMYGDVMGDNDHRIDLPAFVRARLFDMLLSDWDRHKNQWYWAAFEDPDGKGKLYRPIPKDRDWAFNRFDGVLPSLARIGFDPKFQQFGTSYGNLKGLTLNGMPQDRRLTGPAPRTLWIEQAESLRTALTDEVLAEAIDALPQSVSAYHGALLLQTLKRRRDQLVEVADAYYRISSRRVDLFGSMKHEWFDVRRIDDEDTEVVVYKMKKKGERRDELYRRTFHRSETEEIVLYGLDGDDRFTLAGESRASITVRVVGGEGDDALEDRSRVRRGRRKTIFYDTRSNQASLEAGPETRIVRSDDPAVNAYDPLGYTYDTLLPQVFFGFNDDDGLYLGGGVRFIGHQFRKMPFASNQRLVANIAGRTGAYNAVYEGLFVDAFGARDLLLEARIKSPRSIRNFFGLGNETRNVEDDAAFYQARIEQAQVRAGMVFGEPGLQVSTSGHLRFTEVTDASGGIIAQLGISPESFDDQVHAGAQLGLDLDQTDHPANPKQGLRWRTEAQLNAGVFRTDEVYGRLGSWLALYLSPLLAPQLTLATRIGAAHNLGDFPFYEANTIGGRETVRGWRSNRFAGRTSAYANAEVRLQLATFSTYLALGQLGALGFFDVGRVWTEADDRPGRVWHPGYGGGLWLSFFDAFVLTGTYGVSPEQPVFTLGFGFLY